LLARPDVAPLLVGVAPRFDCRSLQSAPGHRDLLLLDDGVCLRRERGPRRDGDGLPRRERGRVVLRERLPVDDVVGVLPGRVERVAVHRGVVGGRTVGLGDDVGGERPAGDGVERDGLRLRPFERGLAKPTDYRYGLLPPQHVLVIVTHLSAGTPPTV